LVGKVFKHGAPRLTLLKKNDRIDTKGFRNLLKRIDGRSILLALYHPDVVAIQACSISQLFLSEAAVLSETPQISGYQPPQLHAA
jgi:hypothetical protein